MTTPPGPVEAGIAEQRMLAALRERVGWQARQARRRRAEEAGDRAPAAVRSVLGRLGREESGQSAVMLVAGLFIVLLGFVGLTFDIGHAYVVKQKLQATADAAALAGAGSLPSVADAQAVAAAYGPAGKNPFPDAAQDPASGRCLTSLSYCFGNAPGGAATNGKANGLVVSEHATVATTFLKLVGIPSIDVSATSTACGMCGAHPLDIALVVDRTGSMGDNIDDLRSGIDTFLQSLDPDLDQVSLLVLPPAPGGDPCTPADSGSYPLSSQSSYPSGSDDAYLVDHLADDYLQADGQLNQGSALVRDVNCIAASGSTSYTQALVAAQNELMQHGSGRKGVQRVIVFESDGAANEAPDSAYDPGSGHRIDGRGSTLFQPTSSGSDEVLRPCGSAVDYANSTIKPGDTIVFTVAYQVDQDDGCDQAPHLTGANSGVGYKQDSEGSITAASALASIASPNDAFSASNAAQMNDSFATIADKITGASLVPDSEGE